MSTGKPNRNLLIIIAVLLITNIAVLAYFLWFNKPVSNYPPRGEKNGIAEPLKKEVGFNEQQIADYKALKEKQREKIRPLLDEMGKTKQNLFRLLSQSSVSDSLLNSLADDIAAKQKNLDLETFYHFQRVRMLCTPDQQPRYDSMILKIFRRMGKPKAEAEKAK